MTQPFSEEIKQQWKEKILNQHQSKLSIASWCQKNGIAVHTFYYWRNKLFPKPILSRSAFTEAIGEENRSNAGIILEYRGFHMHLIANFDPSLLKKCLEVLKEC